MRIQITSDLHLNCLGSQLLASQLIVPAPEADMLVLAGDIHTGVEAIAAFADWPVPVLYVAGNHEYYGRDMAETRVALARAAEGTAVRFLDNESVTVGGLLFLGTTLWTDYRLNPKYSQLQLMRHAQFSINDHRYIQYRGKTFTPEIALEEHNQARAWLAAELAVPERPKTVVISHHAPHPLSVHARYQDDPVNAAFVSNLSELLPQADAWIHGHTHNSFEYNVKGCRVVANPSGYALNRLSARTVDELKFENPLWAPNLVIEV